MDSSYITNYAKSHSVTDPIRYKVRTVNQAILNLTANARPSGGVILTGISSTVRNTNVIQVTIGATNKASRNRYSEAFYLHTIEASSMPQGEPTGSLPVRFKAMGIAPQFVEEGDPFNIDIEQYVEGRPTSYQLDSIRREPNTLMPDPPDPSLDIDLRDGNALTINSQGVIRGVGDLVNAPNVTADDKYTITVRLLGDPVTETDATRAFLLTIQQKEPLWGNIPNQDEDEENALSLDVSRYVEHEPDTYEIRSVTSTQISGQTAPPALQLSVSNTGVISHPALPKVDRDQEYAVGVTAKNNAGENTG